MKLTLLLLVAVTLQAKIDMVKVAAGTTIGINLLDAKAMLQKMKQVGSATKRTTVKVAKKAVGK